MTQEDLLKTLLNAEKVQAVEDAIREYVQRPSVELTPFGRRANNRGAIEVASDPARSAIERVTNAHDALLELENNRHSGKPECRSPREAASVWLGVPEKTGLSGLTSSQRQELARSTVMRLEPGEGWQSRILTITDRGTGIEPEQMESTILSLNESNKIQKHYLAGTYGQGGSSTLAFSKYILIASRAVNSNRTVFTVVWYEDLPAEQFKTGRYVYLTEDGVLPTVDSAEIDVESGTVVRHFGFDLTSYPNSIGPKSLYGALQRILFDPVAPIWFENHVHNWNRTIKGARNALNGAIDQGDDGAKGPELDYHLPMFNVSLGDNGSIGIEYWVLARKKKKDGSISSEKPSRAFVDDAKPIIMTHNGQNQGELTARIIKKEADLPYLQRQGRLIVHVNCDSLSPSAKRMLFSSTREQWREGFIHSTIQSEIIELLASDDELRRLNDEARDQSLKEKDKSAEKKMQRQVARLLRLVGPALAEVKGTQDTSGPGPGPEPKPYKPKKPLKPIETREPPTFIRIVANEDKPIKFYPGQRKYIRIETDANSHYHDADDPEQSRLNVAVGDDLEVFGTSPLQGGRLRIGVRAKSEVAMESTGSIRVEIYRSGASALSDERGYCIVEQPKPKEGKVKTAFPDFRMIPVDGPTDDRWMYVTDDSGENDTKRHASGAEMAEGVLYVYYSTVFPRFATEKKRLEQSNPILARSFQRRYELWLAVHALLKHEDEEAMENESLDEESSKEQNRQERCRLASIAAMVGAQEVESGVLAEDEDAA